MIKSILTAGVAFIVLVIFVGSILDDENDAVFLVNLTQEVQIPRVLSNCMVCHDLSGTENRVGPHLSGLFGRKAGSVRGFAFTEAMKSSDFVWQEDRLREFLRDPQGVVSGTSMAISAPSDGEIDEIVGYFARGGRR